MKAVWIKVSIDRAESNVGKHEWPKVKFIQFAFDKTFCVMHDEFQLVSMDDTSVP